MRVRDIAKKQVISVGAEMELGEVCQILTENHIKKAPVLENGKMIGIINMSNITKICPSENDVNKKRVLL